jgi:ubiquitin carboxyl-terminal hydrolase 25/28
VRQLPWKNKNPVIFEPTIYLDRYMDSDDPSLMSKRREAWQLKRELKKLQARQEALKATEIKLSLPEALVAVKGFVEELEENEVEGVPVDRGLTATLEHRLREVTAELEDITEKIGRLKQRLSEQFADLQQYKYDLQTVFIHRGESSGGHYWIYIYDFKSDIWREYNDEHVTEVKDRSRIFDNASQSGGTPYYLAYVRSADKDDLVDAVCRDVKEEPEMEMVETTAPVVDLMDQDEGITVDDNDEDEGGVRHVEYVRPRPLLPKSAAQTAAGTSVWESHAAASEHIPYRKQW